MRLFVALDLPHAVKDRIKSIMSQLAETRPDVKWVEMRNLHITLKFLGDVHEDRVKDVVKVLQDVALETQPFTLSFKGLDMFGNPPQVLWVDMQPKHQILDLMKKLDASLNHIHRDTHEPTAHLTIGRFRSSLNAGFLRKKLEMLGNVKVGEMNIERMILKQSVLGKTGPVYTDMNVFTIGSV